MNKVLVTGAQGLLGVHCRSLLHARNCARIYQGDSAAYELVCASKSDFGDVCQLAELVSGCAVVFHLAGINRATDEALEHGNAEIAELLVAAMRKAKARPHVIYANSVHYKQDTPYGKGKAAAHQIFTTWAREAASRYTNVILPHLFGEGSKPFYNTVTATLCKQVTDGAEPSLTTGAQVELLHAGKAAEKMLTFAELARTGDVCLDGTPMSVAHLYKRILTFKQDYDAGVLPDLSEPLSLALFNTYRSFEYPNSYPRALTVHEDPRGTLFEAVKGGGGGQTFLSWTEPGVVRGNHFHRYKMERFLVISGTADIQIRHVFNEKVATFSVSGERLQVIDIPTLHTHCIVNTGREPLLTLFWANEIFDPDNPDTYAEPVIRL